MTTKVTKTSNPDKWEELNGTYGECRRQYATKHNDILERIYKKIEECGLRITSTEKELVDFAIQAIVDRAVGETFMNKTGYRMQVPDIDPDTGLRIVKGDKVDVDPEYIQVS